MVKEFPETGEIYNYFIFERACKGLNCVKPRQIFTQTDHTQC